MSSWSARVVSPIESLADAVAIAVTCTTVEAWPFDPNKTIGPPYNLPFGVWYRGQASSRWDLQPSIFRQDDKLGHFDETSIYHHFQLRSPNFREAHQTPFEWLCLMQHYRAPTRLLDWTESILVALYFAVAEVQHDGDDALLFVLNSRLLNALSDTDRVTTGGIGIHIPISFNVVLRSLMAVYCEPTEWFASGSLDVCDETDTPPRELIRELRGAFYPKYEPSRRTSRIDKFLEQLRKPVAVFPFRTNARLQAQSGTFTIHGGKKAAPTGFESDSGFLLPMSFEDLVV